MKRFLLLLLCTAPALAGTGTAQISFTRPSSYSDGTPLPASSISGYIVGCTFQPTGSSTKAPCASQTPTELPGSATSGAVTFTYPAQGGEACFSLRTRVGAALSAPAGGSGAACNTLEPLAPNGPSNVVITITVTVTGANP